MKHENKIKYEERSKTGRERGQVNGNRQQRIIVKGKGKMITEGKRKGNKEKKETVKKEREQKKQ